MKLSLLTLSMIACLPGFTQELKVKFVNGYLLVEAHVNGAGPSLVLLVDTGAEVTSLSPEAGLLAGLKFDEAVTLRSPNAKAQARISSGNTVTIGPRTETNLRIVEFDMHALHLVNRKVDGILGQNFLARTPLLIDYDKHRMVYGDLAQQASRLLPVRIPRANIFGLVAISAIVAGLSRQVVVDSGANALTLACPQPCTIPGKRQRAKFSTQTGPAAAPMVTLDSVQVGETQLVQLKTLLIPEASFGDGIQGLLPSMYFEAIYFDLENVRFRPLRHK